MKRSLFALAFVVGSVLSFAACDSGDGDDIQQIDAAIDGQGGGDGSGSDIDGGGACLLQSAVITCTVGNDAPCAAMCANAYCYNYNQLGSVCTQPCSPGSSGMCPTGWTCNGMGRCRPPN